MGSYHLTRPSELTRCVQLRHVNVRVAPGREIRRSAAWFEVGGALERSGSDYVPLAVGGDGIEVIPRRTAEHGNLIVVT